MASIDQFELDALIATLDDEERLRLKRFAREKDQKRYVLSHAIKRIVLAEYLQLEPSQLTFDKTPFGKPYCEQADAPYFNISHSGDWIVFAVSVFGDVGVDVECPRVGMDQEKILQRVCSPAQINVYRASKEPEATFLCLWTQKEAVSKAHGQGISVGLSGIECSGVVGNQQVRFLSAEYSLSTFIHIDNSVVTVASDIRCQPVVLLCDDINIECCVVDCSFFGL